MQREETMYTNNRPIAEAVQRKKALVAAHRGTCGGNIVWNTTLSYKNALLHGADMIEIDVSMTRDGVFYAFHNTEEEQEFGRKCDIREMTSREVDEINLLNCIHNPSGQHLERLGDVLPKFKGKCLINIDRSWFYWEKVIAYLKSMEMDDQILLKCGVEEDYLRQLADSKSGLMYMPIVRTINAHCPKCGGAILVRNTKRGRVFYGCERYPDCDFTSWDMPVDDRCPLCGSPMVLKRDRRKDAAWHVCTNENCKHRVEVEIPAQDEAE